MFTSAATLLQLTLLGYALGAVASLFCLRRERWANGLGFGAAAVASLSGALTAVSFLANPLGSEGVRLELFSSPIPGLVFSVLEGFLIYSYRGYFAPMFTMNAVPGGK